MYGSMETGSLLRAGLRHEDSWGRIAAIVNQILRGANPATIPFELPTHAEVELDRRTAKAIGVSFPPEVLMRATKVIE
jgi:putative ABC transport system substrate-binding protein